MNEEMENKIYNVKGHKIDENNKEFEYNIKLEESDNEDEFIFNEEYLEFIKLEISNERDRAKTLETRIWILVTTLSLMATILGNRLGDKISNIYKKDGILDKFPKLSCIEVITIVLLLSSIILALFSIHLLFNLLLFNQLPVFDFNKLKDENLGRLDKNAIKFEWYIQYQSEIEDVRDYNKYRIRNFELLTILYKIIIVLFFILIILP